MTLREIRIDQLPNIDRINNEDVFVIEAGTTTYKINAQTLINYINSHSDINSKFVNQETIGINNGIAPLNSNGKINSEYIQFGNTAGTVFEGNAGKSINDKIDEHKQDNSNPHGVTKSQVGLGNVENKSSSTIRSELTYKNVTDALGYRPEIDGTYEQATAYTDQKINELIGGASETLNTLKELEDAIKDNKDIIDVLNEAIGGKANESEFDSHVKDTAVHMSGAEKQNLSTAYEFAIGEHARVDATKTENSTTNGNIKINGSEAVVYQHPISGVTAGTYRQVTVDSLGHVISGNNNAVPISQGGTGATTATKALENLGITATSSEINKLDGTTVTTTELNQLSGVTSPVQTQLDGKAPTIHGNHVPNVPSNSSGAVIRSNGTGYEWKKLSDQDIIDALGYRPGTSNIVHVAVKGDAETEYRTGEVNITPANIGLGRVNNTADNEKSVLSASKLTNTRKIGDADFNGTADISLEDMGVTTALSELENKLTNNDMKTTTDRTLPYSFSGGIRINEIQGKSLQNQFVGKNLLNPTLGNGTKNGVTYTKNSDGSYTFNGTASANTRFNLINETTVIYNGQIKLMLFTSGTSNGKLALGTSLGNTQSSVEQNGEVTGCFFYFGVGATFSNFVAKPMVTTDLSATSYEPYVGNAPSPSPTYPQEVESVVVGEVKSCGKNLNNINNLGGWTYTGTLINGNKVYKGTVKWKGIRDTNIVLKKGITYCVSAYLKSTANMIFYANNSSSAVIQKPISVNNDWTFVSFNLTPSVDLTIPRFELITEGDEAYIHSFMISDETSTIHLSTPITLRGINSVTDKIIKKNGVWGVERYFDTVDLGTLRWSAAPSNSRIYAYGIRNNIKAVQHSEVANILCTSLKAIKRDGIYETSTEDNVMSVQNDGALFGRMTSFTNNASLNGTILTYELATPTFEPLPQADQLALNNLKSFDNVTYIYTDSEVEPTIDVDYGTSKVGAVALDDANEIEILSKNQFSGSYDDLTNKPTIPTYSSKAAASGGTDVSLVTTGEKYTWNNKAGTAVATTSANGLMSSADKTKLNGIATGANKYSLPTASGSTLGGVKIGSNITNTSGTISLTKANVVSALGYTPPTTGGNPTQTLGLGIDITADFDNGTFSANLDKYSPGNIITKTYNGRTYVAMLADYNTFFSTHRSINLDTSCCVIDPHWVAIVLGFTEGKYFINASSMMSFPGFIDSDMYTWLNGECTNILKQTFGENHLILKAHYLSSVWEVPDIYYPNSYNLYAMLLSEAQIFGVSNSIDNYDAYQQLELFRHCNYLHILDGDWGQSGREYEWWLRNISTINEFGYNDGGYYRMLHSYGGCYDPYGYNTEDADYDAGRVPYILLH